MFPLNKLENFRNINVNVKREIRCTSNSFSAGLPLTNASSLEISRSLSEPMVGWEIAYPFPDLFVAFGILFKHYLFFYNCEKISVILMIFVLCVHLSFVARHLVSGACQCPKLFLQINK